MFDLQFIIIHNYVFWYGKYYEVSEQLVEYNYDIFTSSDYIFVDAFRNPDFVGVWLIYSF